ncbi:medium chain dehydrogenase/reductase family protein [Rathayibacter sp. VKM Ac-2759]|uniref:medium chain dehydrogenase/reductase family protein n=1 Tax=Rathayibacter sp. VKM Ac-2759 TaxID=2609252 RepID=UPI001ABE4920|nr:medium chain dehydrogenase/reductase family protein [Rathayibacter sp. VKM Ac-2759]
MSDLPATTLRVVLPGLVEPSGLVLEHAPVEQPGSGELLVAVEATGIAFAEQSMRRGRYFGQPAFPFTPGYDLVGRVLAVGPGGDDALIGRRVASITKTGGWAEYVRVQARDSVVVPDGITSEDAEAVAVNGVTAWQMLHRSARVRRGGTILLFGANSGVGGILIQLARHAGIRVIGAASPRHHEALRAAGVEPVDYADPDLAATVRALAPGGVDAAFDNVGGETTRVAWSLLAPGGALVAYAIVSAPATGNVWVPFLKALGRVALWSLAPNGRTATFYNLWAGHSLRPARFRARLQEDLGRLFGLLADGTVTANIAARFPLTEVVAALELAESRTLNGKVILLP